MKRTGPGPPAAPAATTTIAFINIFIKDIIPDFFAGWPPCAVYFAVVLWDADVVYKDKTKQP